MSINRKGLMYGYLKITNKYINKSTNKSQKILAIKPT